MNLAGKRLVELTTPLPKNYSEYHEISFDTLHDRITFSFPEKGNDKTLDQIRVDSTIYSALPINNCDVARVNSFWVFDSEKYFYKDALYRVRERKDTSGKYYLQKFHVKSLTEAYDYVPDWQFNFKRNLYNACHIFYADNQSVWLFVDVLDGSKKGQWILKLSVADGETMAACKLNDLIPGEDFLFSKAIYRASKGEMIFALQSSKSNSSTPMDWSNRINSSELRILVLDSALEKSSTFKINLGTKHFLGFDRVQRPCNYAVRKLNAEDKFLELELELLAKESNELFSTAAFTYLRVNTDMEPGKVELCYPHFLFTKNAPVFKNMEGNSYRNLYRLMESQMQTLFYKSSDVSMLYYQSLLTPIVLYGVYSVAEKEHWNADKFYYLKGKPTIKKLISESRSNNPKLFITKENLYQFSRIGDNKGCVLKKIKADE